MSNTATPIINGEEAKLKKYRNETFDTDLDRYEEICKQVENEFKHDAEYSDIREFAMPRMQRERVRNYA